METPKSSILILFLIAILFFSAGALYQSLNPGKLFPVLYYNNDASTIPNNPETGFFNIKKPLGATAFFNNVSAIDIIQIEASSDSMRPIIHDGSKILIVFDVPEEQLRVGMIVNFDNGDISLLHRIIAIESNAEGEKIYKTKGDNNQLFDDADFRFEDLEYVVGGILF